MMKIKDTAQIRAKTSRALVLTLISLSACLNSAVKDTTVGEGATSPDILSISPTLVKLSWPRAASSANYALYRENVNDAPIIAGTPNTSTELAVAPGVPDNILVYGLTVKGDRDLRPHRNFKFTSWTPFAFSTFTASAKQYSGIEVAWPYAPWNSLLADPSYRGSSARDAMKMRCYFLKNGTSSSDPFTSSIIVETPVAAGFMQAKDSVETITRYAVGCEVVYADQTVSRNSKVIVITSSDQLVEDRDNAFLTINPVQVSRAISFRANKASDGKLRVNIQAIRPNGDAAGTVYNITKEDLSPGGDLIALESFFPNFGTDLFGGKHNIAGSFTSNETGIAKALAPKEFYVKSADDPRDILYPKVENIAGAQAMGSAVASGDFDCDGFYDLAVGLPGVGWKANNGNFYRTGVVIVYYGSSTGLYYQSVPPSRSPGAATAAGRPPVIIVPEIEGTSTIPQINSADPRAQIRFGHSLAVGNFNRDFSSTTSDQARGHECQDLVIGAPGEYSAGERNTTNTNPVMESAGGSIYIKYGSPDGMKNSGYTNFSTAYAPNDGSCSTGSPTNQSVHPIIAGNTGNAALFPNYNYPNNCPGTRIYGFRLVPSGSPYCLGVSCAIPPYDPLISEQLRPHNRNLAFYRAVEHYPFIPQETDGTNVGQVGYGFGAQFGASVATGDWNNDGFDDLIVGAPLADSLYPAADSTRDPTRLENSGAAFIYLGSRTGIYTNFRQSAGYADETGPAVGGDGGPYNSYSPIKLQMAFPRRNTGDQFGFSVGIAMLHEGDYVGTPPTHTYTEAANTSRAHALVGIPYADTPVSGSTDNRGAVAVKKYPVSVSNQLPPTLKIGVQEATVTNSENDIFWGELAGSLYGHSLAVGNFRDPRLGRANPPGTDTSIGLIFQTRRPFRQAFAVGAPGYASGSGRVYVWTNDSLSTAVGNANNNLQLSAAELSSGTSVPSSLFSTRVGLPLCDSPLDCPGSILNRPSGITGNFGATMGRVIAPRDITKDCSTAQNCIGAWSNEIANRWQPLFSQTVIDSLIVGAPGSSGGGGAYLYRGNLAAGISPSSGTPLTPPYRVAGDQFGAALTGGYYSGNLNDFHITIGAPNQSFFGSSNNNRTTNIKGGGSAFLFTPPSGGGAMLQDSTVDLAQESQDPGGASFLNISVLGSSGFSGSRFVGDLNCDGFGDVIVPQNLSQGITTRTALLVVYGSSTGLVTKLPNGDSAIPVSQSDTQRRVYELGNKAPQWIDISQWSLGDADPLRYFAGIGSVDGDGCDDILVANQNLVVIYGSDSGLVLDSPTASPTGKKPKIVQFPNIASKIDTSNWDPVVTRLGSIKAPPSVAAREDIGPRPTPGSPGAFPLIQPALTEWARVNSDLPGAKPPICHGDFNNDGYGDIAVGSVSRYTEGRSLQPSDREVASDKEQNFNYWTGGESFINSQIFVFYGSQAGIQTQFTETAYSTDQPDNTDTAVGNSMFESTCTEPVGAAPGTSLADTCRPAILFDPFQFVKEGTGTNKRYEPYRIWRDSHYRRSAESAFAPIRDRFGELCTSVGDIDGDKFDDLVIPLPRSSSRPASFVLFRGSPLGLRNSDDTTNEDPNKQAKDVARIVKIKMNDTQPGGTLSTNANLNGGLMGASAAPLGDINGDFYADFALGIPSLIGPESQGAIPNTGGVVLFYGLSATNLVSTNDPVSSVLGGAGLSKIIEYTLCDKPGLECTRLAKKQKQGHLLRPDTFDTSNKGKRFGERIDAAGDVNGDTFPDLLVSMPNYSPPGKSLIGGAFLYFGRSYVGGDIDVGWPTTPSTGAAAYTNWVMSNPSPASNCNFEGRCRPAIIVPEYTNNAFNSNGQRWLASGGMIIRARSGSHSYNYGNYGSRSLSSTDSTLKTSDLILMPQFKFERPVDEGLSDFDHLGGLTVWY